MIDELWSGVAVTGASSVERSLGLSHTAYVAYAFAIPLVGASILEAFVVAHAEAWGRRRLILAGQSILAASLFFVAAIATPWALSIGLAIAGVSSGVACGAAQGAEIARDPQNGDRAMARWSIYAAVGDVLTPIVTAVAIAIGGSYRWGMASVATLVLAHTIALAARDRSGDAPIAVEPPAEPLRAAFARAVRMPRLWAWLALAATCTLLDEIVVALAALRLERERAIASSWPIAIVACFSLGAALGSFAVDRLLSRTTARRLLLASAVPCLVAILAVVLVRSPIASACALFALGLTCAPHHPLALAQAYAQLPDRPGTVQALGQLSVIVDVIAPLVLGVIADRFGLSLAIAALAAQPIAIALGAALLRSRASRSNESP